MNVAVCGDNTKTRQYHYVDMMAQGFTDNQLHGGIFANDNVAIKLSVQTSIVQHVRCKCSFSLISDVQKNCKHTLLVQVNFTVT